jgi:hypothetical protein
MKKAKSKSVKKRATQHAIIDVCLDPKIIAHYDTIAELAGVEINEVLNVVLAMQIASFQMAWQGKQK